MEMAAKDGDKSTMRRLKHEISDIEVKIDEVCYPLEERQKVETAQSKLLNLERSNKVEVSISSDTMIPATVVATQPISPAPSRQEKAAATRKANKLKQLEAAKTVDSVPTDDDSENFEMVEPE